MFNVGILKKIANSSKINALGIEITLMHKSAFPFAQITPTVHMMCAHTHELFLPNCSSPICLYSEQGSEGWHRYLQSYQSGTSFKARQTSLSENIKHIVQRMVPRK